MRVNASRRKAKSGLTTVVRELQQPPKRIVSLTFPQVFRFTCNGAQSAAFTTRGQLLSLILSGSGFTTSNIRLIQAIRVTRLELWDPANGTSTPDNHANITWLGTQSQHRVFDDATVGTAQAAYINTRPPRDSTAYFVSYQGVNESEGLFGLTCGVGAILDVHAIVTLASDYNGAMSLATTANATVAAATYFWNLDGTSGNMRPTVELSRIT